MHTTAAAGAPVAAGPRSGALGLVPTPLLTSTAGRCGCSSPPATAEETRPPPCEKIPAAPAA
eukprot:6408663-Prymnesium_polylepis.1